MTCAPWPSTRSWQKSSENIMLFDTLGLCARFEQNRKQAAKKPKTAQMRAQNRRKNSDETTSTEKRQASPNLAQVEPKLAPSWPQLGAKLSLSGLEVGSSAVKWQAVSTSGAKRLPASAELSGNQRNSAELSGNCYRSSAKLIVSRTESSRSAYLK